MATLELSADDVTVIVAALGSAADEVANYVGRARRGTPDHEEAVRLLKRIQAVRRRFPAAS